MMPVADADLVQRCRQRDRDAFGELVERHQRLVFGVALARCGDAALAEDVAQEAFVTAWRDLDRLRDDARVGTWVAGIARNIAASAARTRARRATPPPIELAAVPTPEDAALAREDRELLARALADVPDAHREALVLYYFEGESIARIAEDLGISEELVKQRLSRGRKALREGVVDRVETALARVRERPALRAGVLAAVALAGTRKAAAASATGKVLAMMSTTKIVAGAVIVSLASGAIYFATRSHDDGALANTQPAAPHSDVSAPTSPHVRRIDPAVRTQLLAQIRAAEERADAARAGASSSSSPSRTPRPALPDDVDLDKQYIRSAVKELLPMITECYEKALATNPRLKGTVEVHFTIEGEPEIGGVVSESTIAEDKTTLPDPQVRECIQQTMYSLEIDPPADGGKVVVHYPFTFAPSEDEAR